jgi:hypothetical protein
MMTGQPQRDNPNTVSAKKQVEDEERIQFQVTRGLDDYNSLFTELTFNLSVLIFSRFHDRTNFSFFFVLKRSVDT